MCFSIATAESGHPSKVVVTSIYPWRVCMFPCHSKETQQDSRDVMMIIFNELRISMYIIPKYIWDLPSIRPFWRLQFHVVFLWFFPKNPEISQTQCYFEDQDRPLLKKNKPLTIQGSKEWFLDDLLFCPCWPSILRVTSSKIWSFGF